MKNNSFHKLILHDFNIRINQTFMKYLLSTICFIVFFLMFNQSYVALCERQIQLNAPITLNPSITDGYLYIFKGIELYDPNSKVNFEVPVVWFMIQSLVSFLVLDYPLKDLCKQGMQIIIRSNSKIKWWLSKCLWVVESVIAFYLLLFFVLFSSFLVIGHLSFIPDTNLEYLLNGFDITSITSFELLITVYILPVLTSVTICLFQMFFSFMVNPVVSFLMVMSYYIISAYVFSPILLGNCSMMLRNNLFLFGGINSSLMMFIEIVLIILVIIFGCYYFDRKDICYGDEIK